MAGNYTRAMPSSHSFPSLSRPPHPTAPCPCLSGRTLGQCCLPYLEGAPAPTPEALMRSRYTAFVYGNEDHLFRTWHPRTRPRPPLCDPSIRWRGLEVVRAGVVEDSVRDGEGAQGEGGTATSTGATAPIGVVEFRAHWSDASGRSGVMHEVSCFEQRGGRWVYVDGEVEG